MLDIYSRHVLLGISTKSCPLTSFVGVFYALAWIQCCGGQGFLSENKIAGKQFNDLCF